jgi:hypothetical protein
MLAVEDYVGCQRGVSLRHLEDEKQYRHSRVIPVQRDRTSTPHKERNVCLGPTIGIGGSLAAPPPPTPPYIRARIRRFERLR